MGGSTGSETLGADLQRGHNELSCIYGSVTSLDALRIQGGRGSVRRAMLMEWPTWGTSPVGTVG